MSRIFYMAAACSCLWVLPAGLWGQTLGIRAGFSSSHLSTDMSSRPSTVQYSGTGPAAGLEWRTALRCWLFLTVSPGYIQKQYTMSRTGIFTGMYTRYTNKYLDLPVSLQAMYGHRWQLYAGLGVYGDLWLRAGEEGRTADLFSASGATGPDGGTTESYRLVGFHSGDLLNERRYRRLETGWTATAGLQRSVRRLNPFVEIVYEQAITAQRGGVLVHSIPQRNRSWIIYTGCRMTFKKRT